MREVEIKVSDIQNCPDSPPRRKLVDFLPVRVLGFLRKYINIPPTPLELWAVMRAYKILIETLAQVQETTAEAYTKKMLEEAKSPEDPYGWN